MKILIIFCKSFSFSLCSGQTSGGLWWRCSFSRGAAGSPSSLCHLLQACQRVMGFGVHVDKLRGPKCACMVPVGVYREISGTQTNLYSEYNASACVCWGILPICKPLGPAPHVESPDSRVLPRLGVCLSPRPCMLSSSWQHSPCRQGRAEAILQLGLCPWLEDS